MGEQGESGRQEQATPESTKLRLNQETDLPK